MKRHNDETRVPTNETSSPPSAFFGRLRFRRLRLATALLALLLLAAGTALGQPTVNGLFYGDGDDALYQPYATSIGGSVLYSYFDISSTMLYVALVVSHAVNDNVCAQKGSGNAYLQSGDAGAPEFWSSHRDCKRASDSEFASFTLECAPMSPNAWTWQQAFGCAQTAGPPPSSWVSADTCPASTGIWPPSIMASTSWVANVNAFQTNGSPAWNMYVDGTDLGDWKTPFLVAFPDDVTQVPGYATYSAAHEWEWSAVYEWSVDLGPGGADCGSEAIFFLTGVSHHSPPKSGPENDSFPPPDEPPIFSDYGDLPDSYATLSASNGPRHYITVDGPYLGAELQTEGDGVPTADASGDGTEEDGLTINVTSDWDPATTQTISVVVANAPAGAVLAGWFDWNGDGDFADSGEYFSWAVVELANALDVVVGAGFDWAADDLSVRLRLFSSAAAAPGGTLTSADFEGVATDGEVEDYSFPPASLPVTLDAFSSEWAPGGGLTVRWQTASETDNVGFKLWGKVGSQWQPLGELIQSQDMNSALPQRYEVEVFPPRALTALELVDYDTRGRLERFGPFDLGASYGELQPVQRIDWTELRQQRDDRLRRRGFVDTNAGRGTERGNYRARWKKLVETETGSTHIAVTQPGIQRVTYEVLREAGLDLAGALNHDIALTFRGEPVSRWIEARGLFGPGSAIEFVGQPPQGDDALYMDANLYQVAVDKSRVRKAAQKGTGSAKRVSDAYQWETVIDRPSIFHHQSATGDPWVEQVVLVRGEHTATLDIPVQGPVEAGPARVSLGLGTVSDLPDLTDPSGTVIPEHNVEVWYSSPGSAFVYLTEASTSGVQDWKVEAEIPSGLLQPGTNRVQLRFHTDYFFSLVLIDRYGVQYPGPYLGPRLDFPPDPGVDGYRVVGFDHPSISAYAEGKDGSLTRITPRISMTGDGIAAELRQVDAVRFWMDDSPHTPAVFSTEKPSDLLSQPADLVVITDSSFVGTQALDDFVASKSDFNPVVVDVEDIYNSVGFGMPLPRAITEYLKFRNEVYPFTYVQLVGADCYDRLNYVSKCVSFIPLPTAQVGVSVYTPSQNRLVDLDGDGVGDKAVGQFSVRDDIELATIVRKWEAWKASALSSTQAALLIAEEGDGVHSFINQIERLKDRLSWSGAEVLDLANHPSIATARHELSSALDLGQTMTIFSGHSSPTVWAFRSLLTVSTAKTLTNFGLPTLMVPLACESTYDFSPNAQVLGHQLLYAGDQGALAISGAVALSSLDDNERMANHILDGLKAGLTLGEAVQKGRDQLGAAYQTLQDNWSTQGDATVRLSP